MFILSRYLFALRASDFPIGVNVQSVGLLVLGQMEATDASIPEAVTAVAGKAIANAHEVEAFKQQLNDILIRVDQVRLLAP